MPWFRRKPHCWLLFVALINGLALTNVSADESITVRLASGGAAVGVVDEKTDDERLWIRREESGLQLRSGYAWSEVTRIGQGGKELTASEFRQIAAGLATVGKAVQEIAPHSPAPAYAPGVSGEAYTPAPASASTTARVAWVQVEACLGQWDADVQSDGLWVFVSPLSAEGLLVPVHGQVELTLLGELERATGGRSDLLTPEFREFCRANEMVRPAHFTRGAAVYQLPFRDYHPELNFDVARQALVHVRLGVPGQGNFEASAANVQLRGFSRVRDQLQLHRGRRFFREENVLLDRP